MIMKTETETIAPYVAAELKMTVLKLEGEVEDGASEKNHPLYHLWMKKYGYESIIVIRSGDNND